MKRHSLLYASLILTVLTGGIAPAFAAPYQEALLQAARLRSPYAVVELRKDPKLQGDIAITDMNNAVTIVGYLSDGPLYGPSGAVSYINTGRGFVISSDGTTRMTAEFMGHNVLPAALNDHGEIAGTYFNLTSDTPIVPVVYSTANGMQGISGLPAKYDELAVRDINNRSQVLVTVTTRIPENEIGAGPAYRLRSFLASRNSSGSFVATEVPLPATTTEPYVSLKNAPTALSYDYRLGITPLFVSDTGTLFGERNYFSGFLYTAQAGTRQLFPGTGPVPDANADQNLSYPTSLSGNLVLTQFPAVLDSMTGQPITGFNPLVQQLSSVYSISADGKILGTYGLPGSHIGKNGILHPTGVFEDLQCGIPQGTRVELDGSPTMMNDTGWVIMPGTSLDAPYTRGVAVLIPVPTARGSLKDFCTTTARFLDRCGRNKNDAGEYFLAPNTSCRLTYEVRDSLRRPVPRANAVLMNGDGKVVALGKTDSRGRGTFLHRFDSRTGSYTVIAPFRNQTYRNSSSKLVVYGSTPRYTGS